jgi:starch phosphorylase
MVTGDTLAVTVSVNLNGLKPEDVVVECLVGREAHNGHFHATARHNFNHLHQEGGQDIFQLHLQPPLPGINFYKIRIYPFHEMLSHPFETGCMIWI